MRLDPQFGLTPTWAGDPSTLDEAAQSAAPQREKLGVQVVRDSGNGVSEWLEKPDAKAVLVRPDRFIFGTAKTAAEVEALTTRLKELLYPGV
jgi:3-(3-hydroxy-phenyl)propionate hydroxylase